MTSRSTRSAALVVGTLVLAACTSNGGATAPGAALDSPPATAGPTATARLPATPAPAASIDPAPIATAPTEEPAGPVLDQPWATTELTDVATGESFRIADLAGKTVILETMAIWCVNCRAQQGDVYAALRELDPDRVAYLLLDVDPNETADALAEYRERNGFTGIYAIAGRQTARALAAEFGDQVLNPPSTPMILIGTDGRVTLTDFGHKGPNRIVSLAEEHGA